MRKELYTKAILTVIATMLVVIALKPYVESRVTTNFRPPEANALLNQAARDLTAIAEKHQEIAARPVSEATSNVDASNSAGNSTRGSARQRQSARQSQLAMPQTGDSSPNSPEPGRVFAEPLLRGSDSEPHGERAERPGGNVRAEQPASDQLPDLSKCLGQRVTLSGSPQFAALGKSDIERARRGEHVQLTNLPDSIPADSHVYAVLRDPQRNPSSIQNFVRAGGNGVGYVLVRVEEDGRVGYMTIRDYEKGTVPLR